MPEVIAIANHKGGVGKTTTCINLAAAMQEAGSQMLIIDIDPQGNATSGCGIDKGSINYSSYDVLMRDIPLEEAEQKTEEGFSLLPTNSDLIAAELELAGKMAREQFLKRALEKYRRIDQFDFILIDCPPSLNMLTLNALVAADSILIPVQCEFFSLEGLARLEDTLREVKQALNPKLYTKGVVRTMSSRNNLNDEVSRQLKHYYGEDLLQTMIPRSIRVAEAPSHSQSILAYDSSSKGSLAYRDLAQEILRRTTDKQRQ